MRVIKFRAWNTVEKTMYYDVGLSPHTKNYHVFSEKGDAIVDMYGTMPALMQYIGFNDPVGKEIFEGDVVVGGLDDRDYVRSVVRIGASEISVDTYENSFTMPYYGVYLEGSIGLEEDLMNKKQYVIGNIYENPELLEVDNV
jgi:uncharacterized phage protein (TIGR01671 family)